MVRWVFFFLSSTKDGWPLDRNVFQPSNNFVCSLTFHGITLCVAGGENTTLEPWITLHWANSWWRTRCCLLAACGWAINESDSYITAVSVTACGVGVMILTMYVCTWKSTIMVLPFCFPAFTSCVNTIIKTLLPQKNDFLMLIKVVPCIWLMWQQCIIIIINVVDPLKLVFVRLF
jgi:hypothetical protein